MEVAYIVHHVQLENTVILNPVRANHVRSILLQMQKGRMCANHVHRIHIILLQEAVNAYVMLDIVPEKLYHSAQLVLKESLN
jgi:hypothetical protein